MKAPKHQLVLDNILDEVAQGHGTRKELLEDIEGYLERPVVALFTSFNLYPGMLGDKDADMLEGILQTMDLKRGLALIISSPGGDGLAAERIIQICRHHSKTGEYWAIVPSRAKSAATIVCFGAEKIIMSPTSELGPIDPQVFLPGSLRPRYYSAQYVVKEYERLFQECQSAPGKPDPYLIQLQKYNPNEIAHFKVLIEWSNDVAVRMLKTGMMKTASKKTITQRLKIFTASEHKLLHGAPIFSEEAKAKKLNVEIADVTSDLWKNVYELYVRTDRIVSTESVSVIETKDHSFTIPYMGE